MWTRNDTAVQARRMNLRFFIFAMAISMDAVSSLPGLRDIEAGSSER
jgi:hypothetical protein